MMRFQEPKKTKISRKHRARESTGKKEVKGRPSLTSKTPKKGGGGGGGGRGGGGGGVGEEIRLSDNN